MILFIEIWNPRQAWHDLTVTERQAYLARIDPQMRQVMASGVEVIGWSVAVQETDQHAGYAYFAVWKMPTQAHARQFQDAIRAIGWYDYFEQVNLSGPLDTPDAVIATLVAG